MLDVDGYDVAAQALQVPDVEVDEAGEGEDGNNAERRSYQLRDGLVDALDDAKVANL